MNDNHQGQAKYVTLGRKGRDFMIRYRREVVADVSGLKDRPGVGAILPAVTAAMDEFNEGRVDVILLAYARWLSTLRQEATIRTLVPVALPHRAEEDQRPTTDYIYEPDPESVLDALLPRYVETQVYQAVLENQASFYSAQMVAMQNATNAAGDLIQDLTLTGNKLRQETITKELMDIVGGAEALRGSGG